jgi:hypothetical protein
MPTSAIRDRCDQIRQRLQRLGEARADQRNENDPEPVTFHDRLQPFREKFDNSFPRYKERREAERNEVYHEPVPFDDRWEKVISEWACAHPKHDKHSLRYAWLSAESSGDAREWVKYGSRFSNGGAALVLDPKDLSRNNKGINSNKEL